MPACAGLPAMLATVKTSEVERPALIDAAPKALVRVGGQQTIFSTIEGPYLELCDLFQFDFLFGNYKKTYHQVITPSMRRRVPLHDFVA